MNSDFSTVSQQREKNDTLAAGEHGRLTVGVVIPAYNPCNRLFDVLSGIPANVDAVVVVDDGSEIRVDGESLECGAFVTLVRHDENMGVGAAIVTGYRKCRQLGMDVAVVMGADDQMDPADLDSLLAPIERGLADYVKGDRLSHRDCLSVMPAGRLFGNICLTFLTRLATGIPVMDSQCGYTALRLSRLDDLVSENIYPRYGFPNDMLAAVSGAGLPVADVTVRPVYGGRSSGIVALVAMLVYPLIVVRSFFTRLSAFCRSGAGVRKAGNGAE